jgi:hypothetical protein
MLDHAVPQQELIEAKLGGNFAVSDHGPLAGFNASKGGHSLSFRL